MLTALARVPSKPYDRSGLVEGRAGRDLLGELPPVGGVPYTTAILGAHELSSVCISPPPVVS